MIKISFSRVCLQFLMAFITVSSGFSQSDSEERHNKVSLRMIGHELLLELGDSTSTILPIEKFDDRYRIRFQSDFQFSPQEIIGVIDTVVKRTKLANKYLVEVETCDSTEIVYSYEIGDSLGSNIIPCQSREIEKACYQIYFTIITPFEKIENLSEGKGEITKNETSNLWVFITVGLLIFIVLIYLKKKKNKVVDPDLIFIGNFQFDKRNMELILKDDITELTSKESDLLILLFTSVNATVEKDVILKEVWGDDGDYIGRTLDVFISKLRKKLEKDPNLKIVNVRGVGYKLIVNIDR